MRLIVARCSVDYTGRLETHLPEAVRLIMVKLDGGVSIWHDGGSSVKPQNWMTPETVLEFERGGEPVPRESAVTPVDPDPDQPYVPLSRLVVRKRMGSTEDKLDIRIVDVISDVVHDMGEAAALEKSGVERELQELLADAPHHCGEGFRLVRREWPTDIGPVDLMCRDDADGWVAVEIKRVGTIDAVEQLSRYLERMRDDPGMGEIRGVLAAQQIKPQARTLAESRGLGWVEIDLAVLRGEREPALKLFDL